MTETIDTAQPGPFVALWQNYCDQKETISQLRDALAAAEARNATLTDDAARYRWLRDFHQGEIRDELPHIAAGGDYVGAWALVGDEADAAIDAARKEKSA